MHDAKMSGTVPNSVGNHNTLLPDCSRTSTAMAHPPTPPGTKQRTLGLTPPRELVGRLFRTRNGSLDGFMASSGQAPVSTPPWKASWACIRSSRSHSSIVTCIQLSASWQPCGERGDAVCYISPLHITTAGHPQRPDLLHRANKGSSCQAKTAHLPSQARHSPILHETI